MENENIRKNENSNEEVVEEITSSETVEKENVDVNEEPSAEPEIIDEESAETITEHAGEDAEEDAEELIGDEWKQDEEAYDAIPIEPLSEEEIAAMLAAKKKIRKRILLIAAAVAAVIALAVAWVCSVEGVGSKTFVSTPVTATVSGDADAVRDNIRYENPVMSIVNSIIGKNKDAVMIVNGKAVDKGVFTFATNAMGINYVGSMAQMGLVRDFEKFDWNKKDEQSGLSYIEYSKGMAAETLIPIYAFIAEGEKRGVVLSEEEEKEIADGVAELKEQYGNDFEKVLNQNGYPSEDAFVEFNRLQMQMNKVYQDAQNDIGKYIDKSKADKTLDDGKITVKHILISFSDENAGEVTDEMKAAAKKKAEEVLAKVKAGEDFDKLIEEYNDDPGASDEGYTFANDGTMVQEFADAAFALNVGETSELVETNYGYHIIKRIERNITVDDYITMLAKTCDVRVRRGNLSDIKVTVNLKDFFGAAPEETEDTTSEAE